MLTRFRIRRSPRGRHRRTVAARHRGGLSFDDIETMQILGNLRAEQADDEVAAAATACLGRVWKIAVTGPATMRRASLVAALSLASELADRTGAVVFTADAKRSLLWLGATR